MEAYKIYRFTNDNEPNEVIKTGLTLEEAQAHCQRDDTHKEGEWFDGYEAQADSSVAAKFYLGQTVITPGASEFSAESVAEALTRHVKGDWGDCDEEDTATNDYALTHEQRLIGVYTFDEGVLWVITEWDRSVTTILLPEEY